MKRESQSTSKLILRILGIVLGPASVILGAASIGQDLKSISLLNSITFIIIGFVFILYGITGKSTFRNTQHE